MVYFSIDIDFNEKGNDNLPFSSLRVRGESFISAYDKLRPIMNPFAEIRNVFVWYMGEVNGNPVPLKYDIYNEKQFKELVSKEFHNK